MCIGGYAVNYYGYHRVTEDLDIWIAPTDKNKTFFLSTLHCMGYAQNETADIEKEDFTTHFMCSLGPKPYVIDILTIVHKDISFDDAEPSMILHNIGDGTKLQMVPYKFLKDIKSRSKRPKDNWDIIKLEELHNKK